MDEFSCKYIVVGAGPFGAVIAERIANDMGEKVVVLDKRNHIGGNCHSEIEPETGIEVHTYGSHIFHTSSQQVWEYVNRFSGFNHYRHKVLTTCNGHVYHMPVNLATINEYFGIDLSPGEVKDFLRSEIESEGIDNPGNLEEKAISLMGRRLYEAFVKGYTMKQWEIDPGLLPAAIISRLPIRTGYQVDYFDDPYQGIPLRGYSGLFAEMLGHPRIKILLNTDYFDVKHVISPTSLVIYTGPVDRFFQYQFGHLRWRTLDFKKEVHDVEDYQGTAVMNYADPEVPHIRIHEFKHYHPERQYANRTVIFKEYSKAAGYHDDPYYPVNTHEDNKILHNYQQKCSEMKNVIFGGRLGSYRYLNMDEAIMAAMDIYYKKIRNGNLLP
jgi:UDP-galactopyranose mutase